MCMGGWVVLVVLVVVKTHTASSDSHSFVN
jgi:hypothetical protein